jgi:hypothetical protein
LGVKVVSLPIISIMPTKVLGEALNSMRLVISEEHELAQFAEKLTAVST